MKKISQEKLINKLVEDEYPEILPMQEISQGLIQVGCISLSQDDLFLICGCKDASFLVCNLKTSVVRKVKLEPPKEVTCVYLFQNNELDQYIIFVGTASGSCHEFDIYSVEEDSYKIVQRKVPIFQNSSTPTASLQSIYQYESFFYTVSEENIKKVNYKTEINMNFRFKIKLSIFVGDSICLGLIDSIIICVPLRELKQDIFNNAFSKYYIYDSHQINGNLETFSVIIDLKVTLAVVSKNKNSRLIQFYRLVPGRHTRFVLNQDIKYETKKTCNFISLIDEDYACIGFEDQTFQIIKLDFVNSDILSIKEKNQQRQTDLVGVLLLNNTISSTILLIDSKMHLEQYQIGTKVNYQLPFIFWVWMRTIKDLELESLMSQNHLNKIMEELKGKKRGRLYLTNQMVFQQARLSKSEFLILNQIDIAKQIKILIIHKVKEGHFLFFEPLIKTIKRMDSLKYFDISYCHFYYTKQSLYQLIDTLKEKQIVLDFLGLAGLKIGIKMLVDPGDPLDESMFEIRSIMTEIDQVAINVSLRDNCFNDVQGDIILKCTKKVKNLKMLDISNNQFSQQTLKVLLLLMNLKTVLFYRFDEDFSLKILCISFTDDLQETAMKAATDYLIRRRMDNNLYIYITRKKDTLWDSSISEYFTQYLREKKVICMSKTYTIIVKCVKTTYWIIKRKGLYCMKQILCTTFFLKKYVACGFCTFLTTSVGNYCLALCGAEPNYYEYNDQQVQLESKLEENHKCYFSLLFFHFSLYYASVIVLPVYFVNKCAQSVWTGHIFYLIFFVISVMIELYIGTEINNFSVAHQYYMGTKWQRYSQIGKDLLISQLKKFVLFTCICFIVLISSCEVKSGLYVAAIIIISVNQIAEFGMIVKNVIFPYRYRREQINQMQVLTYLSMFQSMNMIRKQLEKWPEGEKNYLFFGNESNSFKVPRQVFQIISTLILQDFPMLIVQLAHGAKNADQTTNTIFLCSLLIIIIHCIYLVMQLLTIKRAGLINEDVTLYEYQRQLKLNEIDKGDLKKFVKKFLLKLKNLLTKYNQRNYDIIQSVETDYFEFPKRSNVERARSTATISAKDSIPETRLPMLQEDKKVKFNQKVAQQQQLLNYYSEIYGKEVQAWKLSNDMPYCIVDTLLIDVPRTFFVPDLEWDKQYDQIKNIKISSLNQEVEGFDYAYEFFKNKRELDILDLGFGSGYVSLVLLALALRRNPRMIIRLYLVDHVEEAQDQFIGLLNSKFKDLKEKARFNYQIHDCIKGFTMFGDQKFDFIHMGFGATGWRIEKQIIPLLKDKGKLFGYKIVTSALQKQFTWDNETRSFKYNLNNHSENYGIMEPLVIQEFSSYTRFIKGYQFIYPCEKDISKFKIQKQNQCAQCYQVLDESKPQFINPYWGECICFMCGTDQLKQQGKENDIAKFKYKCDVIFYSGSDCDLSKIRSQKYLFENRIYPLGDQQSRKYKISCRAQCNRGEDYNEGFLYRCLVCQEDEIESENTQINQNQKDTEHLIKKYENKEKKKQGFCNLCGIKFIEDYYYMQKSSSAKGACNCFKKHPILITMFPTAIAQTIPF